MPYKDKEKAKAYRREWNRRWREKNRDYFNKWRAEHKDYFKKWRKKKKSELYNGLLEENKELKERIDILYEFIERNDKLVDEVINEEDLDKLNRYIYIDDDLVDRTLESED